MKNKVSSGAHVSVKRRFWSWQHYLDQQNAQAAPPALFTPSQGFPSRRAAFKVGMKLEGIDPLHPSMFCVLTVAEVIGCRLRLHIDGFSECYDFWVNADSADIRPPGWCKENNQKLHPPKGHSETDFDWQVYLQSSGSQAAPPTLFETTGSAPCGFKVGMKLEAVDKKNPGLVCVASVANVVEDRILVHFDNWDDTYDYWCDSSSPYIHPVGWCEEQGRPLTSPQGHPNPENFLWEEYLEETGSMSAPSSAFTLRAPHGFQVNHRLEAVDRRNPMLVRVATVTDIEDYRVKVHYDGWSDQFDVWCDSDLSDLHPVGWCQRTGHPLECPPGETDRWWIHLSVDIPEPDRVFVCSTDSSHLPSPSQGICPTPGCRGVGHIRGAKYTGHHRLLYPSSLQAALHQSVFLSAMSAQPGRDLSLCWEQHRKLLPGVIGVHADAVQHWSVQQVSDFIESLPGCEEQAKQFRDEQIDGRAFLLLTQRDIVRIMSIKLGPALKIYNSILMFKHADDKSQPQAKDGGQSQAHNKSQSKVEDGSQSQAEDKSQSQREETDT
uniref:SAM domain-containing protein n=1 Tax=Sphaeramia orbicularis TaxID=375764 RepID=A0A673AIL7_9TELE